MTQNEKKPNLPELRQRFVDWISNEENKGKRLVNDSKLKELSKALDPEIRMDSKVHTAMCREIGRVLIKAMLRTWDNKRVTVRGSDV